ncbi:MAG TPA: hypothetical protein P5180_08100, partial [Bacteroidales bacterium]|nr:hypothetical protein [Bacteroidales bacterium]HRW85381.1 hypothetical protein [Bacteroidales bacterium]
DASFMLSIAKIPWIGRYFIGFLSYLYLDKQFYLFNTYNKSTFTDIQNKEEALHITLKSKTYNLRLRIIKNSFCDLQAPVSGEMSRRIKESIDSEIELQLLDLKGNTVFQDTGKKVGLEIITEIFNYL